MLESRISQYEEKIEQLSTHLNEEEEAHRALTAKLESKIDELQQAMSSASSAKDTPSETVSPVVATVIPVSKSKVKILEQRIVELTITLDEKDKRMFDLESEIDRVKVELNQVRVEALRVPELEATILDLDNQLSAHQSAPHASDELSSHVGDEIEADVPPQDDLMMTRVGELERTVSELTALISELRMEKEQLLSERSEMVRVVADDRIMELEKKVSELEEQIEISEVNKKILKENFARENEEKLALQIQLEMLKKDFEKLEKENEEQEKLEEKPEDVEVPIPSAELIAAENVIQSQKIQIETMTMELHALRSLPKNELTLENNDPFLRPSPKAAACGGCFPRRRRL
jgi:DNA repair exonuclease SbcCD ATPase subunit